MNGAGKSKLYQSMESLREMERVNVDEIARRIRNWKNTSDVFKAGEIAVKAIDHNLKEGISFNQETTLCGRSIIKNIERAKRLGYYIEVHYVGLNSVDIAKERVAYRVAHGGHGVSDVDVERRYKKAILRGHKL